MHLRHLSVGLAAALLCAAAALAATVYKWTDAQGVVHFSDQPVPGAERIITQSGAAAARFGTPPPPAISTKRSKPDQPASEMDYTAFAIDSPQPEQSFNDASVNVRVHLEPALKANHVISLYLNGKRVENQPPDALQFSLDDLPRGTYTVIASVMDSISGESKSTEGVTFYMRRPSVLSPQSPLRKKP